jgi:hypothetical protein
MWPSLNWKAPGQTSFVIPRPGEKVKADMRNIKNMLIVGAVVVAAAAIVFVKQSKKNSTRRKNDENNRCQKDPKF